MKTLEIEQKLQNDRNGTKSTTNMYYLFPHNPSLDQIQYISKRKHPTFNTLPNVSEQTSLKTNYTISNINKNNNITHWNNNNDKILFECFYFLLLFSSYLFVIRVNSFFLLTWLRSFLSCLLFALSCSAQTTQKIRRSIHTIYVEKLFLIFFFLCTWKTTFACFLLYVLAFTYFFFLLVGFVWSVSYFMTIFMPSSIFNPLLSFLFFLLFLACHSFVFTW